jgi:hypothetical protein
MVVMIAVSTVAVLRTDPPTVFVVLGYGSLVLEAVILVFLWHPETSRYMREETTSVEA